ncbi:MAG: ARMT1-like domain-containing protein, partial [Vampirovibrionia bacterium]
MKTFYDCIPCFIKQTLDVSRLSSPEDDAVHGEIVKAVLNKIIDIDMNTAPPIVARDCHRIIKALSGNNDPYKFIKDKFNKEALALYPQLKAYIDNAEDKFYMAAKVAIAGNIIDFGHRSVNDDFNLLDSVKVVLSQEPAINNIDYLKNQVESAAKILYI